MTLDAGFKELVRDRIDFPALVAETVALKRSPNGSRAVPALCPFHDNTNTPAMAVYEDHAYCFVCRRSWDLYGWLMTTTSAWSPPLRTWRAAHSPNAALRSRPTPMTRTRTVTVALGQAMTSAARTS